MPWGGPISRVPLGRHAIASGSHSRRMLPVSVLRPSEAAAVNHHPRTPASMPVTTYRRPSARISESPDRGDRDPFPWGIDDRSALERENRQARSHYEATTPRPRDTHPALPGVPARKNVRRPPAYESDLSRLRPSLRA